MSYRERFKEMAVNSLIGLAIGFVISIILTVVIMGESFTESVGVILVFTIFFGAIAAIIICAKKGTQGYMSGAVSNILVGFKDMFFGSLFTGSVFSVPLLIWGIIKLFIGLVILIPIVIYMSINYIFNIIYLGIMALLEKFNKLENKQDLCEIIDKIVPILSLVVTVVACVAIFRTM